MRSMQEDAVCSQFHSPVSSAVNASLTKLTPHETDTVMAYKARNKIGRFAENTATETHDVELPSGLTTGARVKVAALTERDIERIGTIRYIGSVGFAPNVWVGVEYDEPVGKNNGTVEGKQYFVCRPKYGGFVKPERCQIGDWPSLDDELDLDSE